MQVSLYNYLMAGMTLTLLALAFCAYGFEEDDGRRLSPMPFALCLMAGLLLYAQYFLIMHGGMGLLFSVIVFPLLFVTLRAIANNILKVPQPGDARLAYTTVRSDVGVTRKRVGHFILIVEPDRILSRRLTTGGDCFRAAMSMACPCILGITNHSFHGFNEPWLSVALPIASASCLVGLFVKARRIRSLITFSGGQLPVQGGRYHRGVNATVDHNQPGAHHVVRLLEEGEDPIALLRTDDQQCAVDLAAALRDLLKKRRNDRDVWPPVPS